MKTVLTIAGFDPSSGAGITADLMVFAAHSLFGTSCISALTVQSTLGVAALHPVAADVVRATLDQLQDDLPAAGIKIGMLATAETVEVVADFLARTPGIPVVLDPVLRSSSGRELLSPAGVALLRERLLPLVTWVTPNLEELGVLAGQRVTTREDMERAGRVLLSCYPRLTVLATGGHLERPDDLLLEPPGEERWLPGDHIETSSTHGTGCALSSALLSRLVLGDGAFEAAETAKAYVLEALRTATPIGSGKGPINSLWPLRKFTDIGNAFR
jgi:hydroxymethylpyrimidine/phosphomethylpyrimidine kinase